MSPFKPFYNDWLDVSSLFEKPKQSIQDIIPLNVNLDVDFFKSLSFETDDLKKYRIDAAKNAFNILGEKPALCFSGGIDSQVMLQSWLEAELPFDVFVLVFKNNLNDHDVSNAYKYCKEIDVKINEIELDVTKFLSRENDVYALKYDSISPHFNVHYKMFNMLQEQGYTGVCCGGNAPGKFDKQNNWGANYIRNPLNFIKYTEVSEFPCLGNFLGFYPELAWSLALQTTEFLFSKNKINFYSYIQSDDTRRYELMRYHNKVESYQRSGVKILSQENKFTGFEKVKLYYENQSKDPWCFEKRFRYPLEKMLNHQIGISTFIFRDNVLDTINDIHKTINYEVKYNTKVVRRKMTRASFNIS